MLNIDIICVGGLKERYWRDACAEYCKRLTAWARVRVTEVAEERPRGASPADVGAVVEAEGGRILATLPERAAVIALCIEGRRLSSQGLSDELSAGMVAGESAYAFVIGGSHGLSDKVKERARLRLSMSDMTFPHQLSRVMLLEQLYRALSIAAGTKYHK